MGRLVGLELHNFKSYRGTSKIGFGTSFFTSIIGPNGAGKSNMMDAISFVLGVKSSHLRSQNMKDLIYRGRVDLLGSDDRENLGNDPTSAYVMALYEKDNGEVLKLQRIITVSGNSDYKINGKTVTSLHYSTVLKTETILIRARNFLVFQGDVEQVASQSPKELSKLFEAVSGSVEYVKEYDELKQKYEEAREFSNSVFSRKRTLNSESKQYKEQLVEQREFERNLIAKTDIIKKMFLYKIYHNEKKHFSLSVELEHESKKLKELEDNVSLQAKDYETIKATHVREELKVTKNFGFVGDLVKDLDEKRMQLIPLESNQKMTLTKIASCKRNIESLERDIAKQDNQVSMVTKSLKDAERLFEDFKYKVGTSRNLNVSDAGQKEYETLREQYLANGGSQLEEQVSELMEDQDFVNATLDNIRRQKLRAVSRVEELMSDVDSELKIELSEVESKVIDNLAMKQEKVESRKALIKARDDFNFKELQLNSKLRDTLVKLEELSSQQRESNKQKRLRENVSMLKKLFPKYVIRGLVYDLVRPSQQKFEAALSTVLARHHDAVIVESASVAHKCIEILKERRSGVISFIPLDTLVVDPINLNYLRSIDDSAQPAMDIIEYDDRSLEQAINYVVGDTLVMNNIEAARNLKWNSRFKIESKIVTLDGSVIHKSGLMTGGNQGQRSGTLLSWDKNELSKISEVKEDLLLKLEKLAREKPKELQINLLADEATDLDNQLALLRSQQTNLNRKIEDKEREIEFQKTSIVEYEARITEQEQSLGDTHSKLDSLLSEVKKLQDSIYTNFCSKYKLDNGIDDYENLHGFTLRARAKEKASFTKSITTLKNKLNFETELLRDTRKRKSSLKDHLVGLEKELKRIDSEKNNVLKQIDQIEAEIEISNDEKSKAEDKLLESVKQIKKREEFINELDSERKALNSKVTGIEENILKTDTERMNILKDCKLQNINLPLINGVLDSISIEESADFHLNHIYDIELDYEMLDERLKESYSSKMDAELHAQLTLITEALDKLTPNAKAVERLKEVDSRLKEFDRDHSRARVKEKRVAEKFQEIRLERYNLFMEAFNHISGRIDFIYKELTKSSSSPLGGSAYLTLEDEENPYNSGVKYHAMPPMKRFRDMELLSGGEKTMAALALLFAIHSYHPSPFFVLDEVDAALDNTNVTKIGNYIRKHAGPNFQFIVISLKNSLFEKSDSLVGIYRQQEENSSRTVTLDLREYPEDDTDLSEAVAVA